VKFEMSNQIALQHPDWKESKTYYEEVMGLDVKMEKDHLHIQKRRNEFIHHG